MADEQVQAQEQVQVEEPNVEATDKLVELEEKYKKELAGLNKRNSELEKKVKLTEQEKMTEAEKLEAERKELQAEKDSIKRERINLQIIKELASVGLPADFANRISGETEDEIKADVKALNKFLDERAHERSEAEIAKRLAGESPKGGTKTDVTTLQGQYDKAKARNDVATMVALKRQAKRSGETLKEF